MTNNRRLRRWLISCPLTRRQRELGLTAVDAASLIGVATRTYHDYRRGDYLPRDEWAGIAAFLGLEPPDARLLLSAWRERRPKISTH